MLGRFIRQKQYEPRAGDLVTVEAGDGGSFAVAKVLKVDSGGVHVRLYAQRFSARPQFMDVTPLSAKAHGPGYDNPFSIGHVPLTFGSFEAWRPEFLAHGDLVEEELEGYLMWAEAEGGYF